jgi:hypothetical protein
MGDFVTFFHYVLFHRIRADAARERDELGAAMEARIQVLYEARGELRTWAERGVRA